MFLIININSTYPKQQAMQLAITFFDAFVFYCDKYRNHSNIGTENDNRKYTFIRLLYFPDKFRLEYRCILL